jgi:hypothetical protein
VLPQGFEHISIKGVSPKVPSNQFARKRTKKSQNVKHRSKTKNIKHKSRTNENVTHVKNRRHKT